VARNDAVERNLAVVRRVYDEVINEGKLDVAAELTTPQTQVHVPFAHPGHGTSGLQKIAAGLREGFPDIRVEVDDIFGVDDKVVARWKTTRQTHTGEYRGLPPTGKEVRVTAIQVFRLENERIMEFWLEMDQLNAVRQMGVVAPEHYQGPRLGLFVLGSVFRMGFLTARHGIAGKRRAKAGGAVNGGGARTPEQTATKS
jgi:predicted ester cyclase